MAEPFDFLTATITLKVDPSSIRRVLKTFAGVEKRICANINRINAKAIKIPTATGGAGAGAATAATRRTNEQAEAFRNLQFRANRALSEIRNQQDIINKTGLKPFRDQIAPLIRLVRTLGNTFRNAKLKNNIVAANTAIRGLEAAQRAAIVLAQRAALAFEFEAAEAKKLATALKLANGVGVGGLFQSLSSTLPKVVELFARLGSSIPVINLLKLLPVLKLVTTAFIKLSAVLARIAFRSVIVGFRLIRAGLRALLSPILSVTRAFRFLTRSILPFVGFGLITVGIRNAIQDFADFEESIARSVNLAARSIDQLAGNARQNFRRISESLRRVARDTLFTAEEVAATFNLLVRGGLDLERALASIKPTIDLAIATSGDPDDAAQLVNVLRNQFGLLNSDVNRTILTFEEYETAVGDIADAIVRAQSLAPVDIVAFRVALEQTGEIAAQTGLTLEETSALLVRLFEGLPAPSKVGTGLARAIFRTLAPTVEGLERLNVAIAESGRQAEEFFEGGRFRPGGFLDLVETLNEVGLGVPDLFKIFGFRSKAISRLFAQFEEGGRSLQDILDLIEKAQELNFADAIARDIEANTLAGRLKLLRSAFRELQFSILDDFINLGLAEFIGTITDKFKELSDAIKGSTRFAETIAALRNAFGRLLDAIAPVAEKIASFLIVFNAAAFAAGIGAIAFAFEEIGKKIALPLLKLNLFAAETFNVFRAFTSFRGAIELATILINNFEKTFGIAFAFIKLKILEIARIIVDAFTFSGGEEIGFIGKLDRALSSLASFAFNIGLRIADGIVIGIGKGLEAILPQGLINFTRIVTPEAVEKQSFQELADEVRLLESGLDAARGKVLALNETGGFRRFAGISGARQQVVFFERELEKARRKQLLKTVLTDPAEKAITSVNKLTQAVLDLFDVPEFSLGGLNVAIKKAEENLLSQLDEPFNKITSEQRKAIKEQLRLFREFRRLTTDALEIEDSQADLQVRFLGLEEFGRLINISGVQDRETPDLPLLRENNVILGKILDANEKVANAIGGQPLDPLGPLGTAPARFIFSLLNPFN